MIIYNRKYFFVFTIIVVIASAFLLTVVYKNNENVTPLYSNEKIAINFPKDITTKELKSMSIMITDSNDNNLPVNVSFFNNAKNIVIVKPYAAGYPVGKTLTLHVNSTLDFRIEYDLKKEAIKNYKIIKETEVKFKDKNLEKAIRDQINKLSGEILMSDVYKLKTFAAESYGISDLSGIENFTSLNKLYLSGNKITDIKKLSKLKDLEFLSLTDNKITSISPLKNLNNLKILYLDGNKIKDFSPVKNYYFKLEIKDFTLK